MHRGFVLKKKYHQLFVNLGLGCGINNFSKQLNCSKTYREIFQLGI